MTQPGQDLALFDFDGTITTKDTMLEFLRFCRGDFFFFSRMAMLLPMLLAYKAGFIPNWRAKEILLASFLKGWPESQLQQKGREFAEHRIPHWVRPAALVALKQHQRQGARCLLISASAEVWLADWCQQMGLECLATRLEVVDGKITGKLASPNCHGPEKVNRLCQVLDPSLYHRIYAYGDSSGDREMLALAHYPHFRPFRS